MEASGADVLREEQRASVFSLFSPSPLLSSLLPSSRVDYTRRPLLNEFPLYIQCSIGGEGRRRGASEAPGRRREEAPRQACKAISLSSIPDFTTIVANNCLSTIIQHRSTPSRPFSLATCSLVVFVVQISAEMESRSECICSSFEVTLLGNGESQPPAYGGECHSRLATGARRQVEMNAESAEKGQRQHERGGASPDQMN